MEDAVVVAVELLVVVVPEKHQINHFQCYL